ncbi:MAG: GGDEF domain-containing protein [Caryophanon sp.]|nr:GGDEF domain-containing protein [Caryophanon sp.]
MDYFIPSRLIILTLCIGYLITLLLIIAYEHKQLDKPAKHMFLWAKFIQIIAWLGIAFGEGKFGMIILAASNSLLFVSYTLEVIALLSLKNLLKPHEKKMLVAFMIASIIGFNSVIYFNNVTELRIIFYSFANVFIYFLMYRMIFSNKVTKLMKLVGSLYWFAALIALIRAILTSVTDLHTDVYTASTFQWMFLLALYIFSNLGTIGFILLMKEEVDRELYHFAHFDDLTGVLNRRSFNKETEAKLLYYAKKREPIHYILFDVDHFKSVNDTYGHLVGDKVLQDLTNTLSAFLQPDDLFGRYGGDEFAILLTNKNEQQAIDTIEQMKQAIQPLLVDDVVVTYSISIGIITTIPTATTHLEALYTSCDQALYEAKKNGRNIFVKGTIES